VLTGGLRFQSVLAWNFQKHRLLKYLVAAQTILVLMASVLSTVLPYKLKNGCKASYIVLLLFFAICYVLLLVFYGLLFRKWKAEQPTQKHQKHQSEGPINVYDIVESNIFFSSIAFIGVIASFLPYVFGKINFEFSLWVSQLPAAPKFPLTKIYR
jgi:hypothetical protein